MLKIPIKIFILLLNVCFSKKRVYTKLTLSKKYDFSVYFIKNFLKVYKPKELPNDRVRVSSAPLAVLPFIYFLFSSNLKLLKCLISKFILF